MLVVNKKLLSWYQFSPLKKAGDRHSGTNFSDELE